MGSRLQLARNFEWTFNLLSVYFQQWVEVGLWWTRFDWNSSTNVGDTQIPKAWYQIECISSINQSSNNAESTLYFSFFWKLSSSWGKENEKLCRAGYHENSKNGILWCDSISYFIGLLWYNLTYQEQSVWCALDVLQRKLETRAIFRNKLYLENFICKAILAGKARHHSTMTHKCDLFRNSKQKSSVHVCSAIKWEIKNARL